MLTGESRCSTRTAIAVRFDHFRFLNSDLEQETKTDQEEHVSIWNEMTPKAQDEAEANLQTPPEDVTCVRLIAPMPGAISAHGLQGNSKRPRISPAALHPEPEILTKPSTSIPAMIIPHLASHRTATSSTSMVFHN
jgi:hypothetical protein